MRKKEFIFEFFATESKVTYIFKHALTQEVSYESILHKKRRDYHSAIARTIECSAEALDNRLEVLAYHFQKAEIREKAVDYLQLCGAKNANSFANDRAIFYYQDAIECIETCAEINHELHSKTFDLNNRLADVYVRIGSFSAAEEVLLKQASLAKLDDHSSLLSQALRRLGEVARMRGEIDAAITWLAQSLKIALESNDWRNEVRTYKSLANTLKLKGEYQAALEYLTKGLEKVSLFKDPSLEADFLNDLATVYIDMQDFGNAGSALNRCEEICRAIGELKETQVSAAINRGVIYYFERHFDAALQEFEKSAKMSLEIGDRKNFLLARHNRGEILLEWKKFDQAFEEFESCFQVATEMGNEQERINNLLQLGVIKLSINQPELAVSYLTQALQKAKAKSFWKFYQAAAERLAQAFRDLNQPEESERILNEMKLTLSSLSQTDLSGLAR